MLSDAFDPLADIPEFKVSAVQLRKLAAEVLLQGVRNICNILRATSYILYLQFF